MYIDIHTHVNNCVVIALRKDGDNALLYCDAIHPIELKQYETLNIDSRAVAIGETGLDYRKAYRDYAPQQRLAFIEHIEYANKVSKPLVIHQVRALDDTLCLLRAARVPVIFHGFSGSIESSKRILNSGYYLSFGHLIMNNANLGEVIKQTPLDRLFLESDQSEIPIEAIYEKAAQLLSMNSTDLERQIEKNYNYVFMARENRAITR